MVVKNRNDVQLLGLRIQAICIYIYMTRATSRQEQVTENEIKKKHTERHEYTKDSAYRLEIENLFGRHTKWLL